MEFHVAGLKSTILSNMIKIDTPRILVFFTSKSLKQPFELFYTFEKNLPILYLMFEKLSYKLSYSRPVN